MVNNIFSVGLNVYTQFVREAMGEIDDHFNTSALDMIFIMVNASKKGDLIPAIGLVRFQFMEILLRTSIARFYNSKFLV
jgi:hypothetical protein